MSLKPRHLQLSVYAALIVIGYIITSWAYVELSTTEAIKIATNDNLSPKAQFSAMTKLAYKDKQDPQAFYMLYSMLYHGVGTPKSPTTALIMLKKSAKAGFGPALEELATIYLNGNEHYKKDTRLGYYWLRQAAKRGMPNSIKLLNS